MSNLIVVITLLLISIFIYLYTKDILCPPAVLSFIWALPFIWLSCTESLKPRGFLIGFNGFYFIAGVLCFTLGFFIFNFKRHYRRPVSLAVTDARTATKICKAFICVELLCSLYFLYDVFRFVKTHYQRNFWFTYKWNVSQGNYTDWFVIPYLRTLSVILSLIMLLQFFSKNKKNIENRWLFLQLVITITINFIGQGRNSLFALIVPAVFLVLIRKRKKDSQIIKVLLLSVGCLCMIFIIYDALKNPYADKTDSLFDTIENYLCGGVVSFSNYLNSFQVYAHGEYTFRFLCALMHPFCPDLTVVPMVEPYVTNINGHIGNVYTFYKWYANDFGPLYALMWQFIIGCLHGLLYKKLYETSNKGVCILYCYSMYALCMQFYMDMYITMLSTWIQVCFWIFLFLNNKIFFSKKDKNA